MCQGADTPTCSREVTDTKNILKIRESKRDLHRASETVLKTWLLWKWGCRLSQGKAAIWVAHTISISGSSRGDGSKAGTEEF